MKNIQIRDLGIIGDRRTCALIGKNGEIVWYCPGRFDKAAYFSSLIDPGKGGFWSFDYRGKNFISRKYSGRSAVLETQYEGLEVVDFMPLSAKNFGICRIFSKAPVAIENKILLKPGYGIGLPDYEENSSKNQFKISRTLYLIASHKITIKNGHLSFTIPAGEKAWAIISEKEWDGEISMDEMESLKQDTLAGWEKISSKVWYRGVYEKEVNDSLRAIQLMTYQENGGILAAATTSLPEVKGGSRNYDYRYVWLRDSAMITSAFIRAESDGEEERKFLSFLCDAKYRNSQKILLPFYSLDKLVAQPEEELPLDGYSQSTPVRTGNDAMDQLQLDANANVLLVAKMVYEKAPEKLHWDTVAVIADFLVERWKEKDHGIWEEKAREHFTSSKVIVSKALEFIAEFAESEAQKKCWLDTSRAIKDFIMENCLTKDGAFSTYPGSGKVDVTAALFPVWLFIEASSPVMRKTIQLIEENHREGDLYHRTLENYDASKEGVFLAGCFWMVQYYIMTGEISKAEKIIEASLNFSNDLGYFAEEGDIKSGEMLGNFPQTFVHASFICAIIDLNKAKENN
jgi:GH15 family glucan-1,4-alpha-glucosidase